MAFFLLINSVGYTVYAHYCDDELKDTSILVNTNEACCEEESVSTSPEADDSMGCCKEQDVHVVLKDQFVKSESGFHHYHLPIIYLNDTRPIMLSGLQSVYANNYFNLFTSPPHRSIPDITLLLGVFRI